MVVNSSSAHAGKIQGMTSSNAATAIRLPNHLFMPREGKHQLRILPTLVVNSAISRLYSTRRACRERSLLGRTTEKEGNVKLRFGKYLQQVEDNGQAVEGLRDQGKYRINSFPPSDLGESVDRRRAAVVACLSNLKLPRYRTLVANAYRGGHLVHGTIVIHSRSYVMCVHIQEPWPPWQRYPHTHTRAAEWVIRPRDQKKQLEPPLRPRPPPGRLSSTQCSHTARSTIGYRRTRVAKGDHKASVAEPRKCPGRHCDDGPGLNCSR